MFSTSENLSLHGSKEKTRKNETSTETRWISEQRVSNLQDSGPPLTFPPYFVLQIFT